MESKDLFETSTDAARDWGWRFGARLKGTDFGALSELSEEDAEANAFRRVQEALTGRYEPMALQFRGRLALVWRDPESRWHVDVCDDLTGVASVQWMQSARAGMTSRAWAEREARSILAIRGWDGEEETSPFILDAGEQAAFTEWVRRQYP